MSAVSAPAKTSYAAAENPSALLEDTDPWKLGLSRPTVVDLFCGVGGLSLGFEQAGFDVVLGVDNDPIHQTAHAINFPRSPFLLADIATLSSERVWSVISQSRRQAVREIDCLVGGPSCQGFSEIGRHRPDDERNNSLQYFVRLLAELQPKYFLVENVPGLLSKTNAAHVTALLSGIDEAGYDLVSSRPFIVDAADYGVPQRRRRMVVMGARRGLELPNLPLKLSRRVTTKEAIGDLPNADDFESLSASDRVSLGRDAVRTLEGLGSDYARFLRSGPGAGLGQVAEEYPRAWDRRELTASTRTLHASSVTRRFQNLKQGIRDPVGRLPRLSPDRPSPTLRAGSDAAHGSFTACRPVHYEYPRVITVREAARLSSFPDWFQFHATKWHGFRQVGNAVPPLLAMALASSIAEKLRS